MESVSPNRSSEAGLVPEEVASRLSFLLNAARQTLVEQLGKAFEGTPLLARHFAVVNLLLYRPGLRQTDIAQAFSLDRTTVMNLVDELEAAKFVQRRPHAEDRRAHAIFITAAGQRWRERMQPQVLECERQFLAPLSPAERALMQELLLRLVTHTQNEKQNAQEG
jgi:DNA-binding MarR family transcriptional regulator